jgi:glutamine synthetase
MPPRTSASRVSHFVDRHGLWSDEQRRAGAEVDKAIRRQNIELVRFSFCDQHGVLRGKTLVASEASRAMRSGVTMTTTLLAKDTSHRTVFQVFTEGGGLGLPEMQGAGDFIMVADPTTFRVLPWAPNTGWMLCDIVFTNGKPVPFCTRQLYHDALGKLGEAGFDLIAGLEVEFHLFKIEDPRLAPEDVASWPAEPPTVTHTTQGYQYLTESRLDQVDAILEVLRKTTQVLGLPLRSIEQEFGPSQYEFTFAPELGLQAADTMVLFRSAIKQVARRHGYLVSLMCRPRLPNVLACGWHLHQSLIARKSKANAFVSNDAAQLLSPLGRNYLAGLLAHARASAAFATPTINGYRRYQAAYLMSPMQALWARDNRGVMVRVMGYPGDTATHLENRIGEPLANPYLYMASQIHAGLDGVARKLDPGPSADTPYEVKAEPLPKSLGEALDALRDSACFRAGFGDTFVDYYVALKDAEIARWRKDEPGDAAAVSAWEHREYFDLA